MHTYYPSAPYYISANTAWLVPNTSKAPLNDAKFRKALAYSIDADQIVGYDYDGAVVKASPTGLLPSWSKYISSGLVSSYGFTYDPLKARSMLKAAGYVDSNGDGYVENKDGSEISLTIMVPAGWFDWQMAIKVIAAIREVGRHQSQAGVCGLLDVRDPAVTTEPSISLSTTRLR